MAEPKWKHDLFLFLFTLSTSDIWWNRLYFHLQQKVSLSLSLPLPLFLPFSTPPPRAVFLSCFPSTKYTSTGLQLKSGRVNKTEKLLLLPAHFPAVSLLLNPSWWREKNSQDVVIRNSKWSNRIVPQNQWHVDPL